MAEDSASTPDVYTDTFQLALNPFGASLIFALSRPTLTPNRVELPKDVTTIRMSLEHAKILAMMLRSNLVSYERTNGLEIAIPEQVYTQLGVAHEDWPH